MALAADDVVLNRGHDAALVRARRAERPVLTRTRLGHDHGLVLEDLAAADRYVAGAAERLGGRRLGPARHGTVGRVLGPAGREQGGRTDAGRSGENRSSGGRVGHRCSSTSLAHRRGNRKVMRINGKLRYRQRILRKGSRTSTQDSAESPETQTCPTAQVARQLRAAAAWWYRTARCRTGTSGTSPS